MFILYPHAHIPPLPHILLAKMKANGNKTKTVNAVS